MKLFYIFLLLTATSLASEEWTQTDKKLYKSYIALQVIDTLQTKNLITCQRNYTCPNLQEVNPLLTAYPTTKKLVITKLVSNIIMYNLLDSEPIDNRIRRATLIGLVAVSSIIVAKNHKNGLSFVIKF